MSLNLAFIPTSKRRAGGKRKPVGLLSPSTLGSPASCTSASIKAKVPQLAGGRAAAQGGRPPGSPCLRFFGVLPYWAAVGGGGRQQAAVRHRWGAGALRATAARGGGR